jgi:hypothetical protein
VSPGGSPATTLANERHRWGDDALSVAAVVLGSAGSVSAVVWWWSSWWVFIAAPLLSASAMGLGNRARNQDPPVAHRAVATAGLFLGTAGLCGWMIWFLLFIWLAHDPSVSF